jgi:hypothetical protein
MPEDSRADDLALGSIRLRGGYDANPQLLPGGKPSAFTGVDAAFALGRSIDAVRTGLTGEIQRADYAAREIDPSERMRIALEAEAEVFAGWMLKSRTGVESARSYNLHSFEAEQELRAQWTGGMVRPFVSAAARYSTLNETNAILTDFLPDDLRFTRVTLIPGMTAATPLGEFGASINLSAVRYAPTFDLFGYRRDNERIEPFLFYRWADDFVSMSAAVSHFSGTWHDVDFTDLRATLFDLSLSLRSKDLPWRLELSGSRTIGETSFPISPVTVSETYAGTLTYAASDAWSLGLVARWLRTGYPDSPFSSRTVAYGLTGSYRIDDDWSLGAEILRVNASALDGTPVEGAVGSLSLSRRFDLTGAAAGKTADPAATTAGPAMKRTAATPSRAQTKRSARSAMPAPVSASVAGVY